MNRKAGEEHYTATYHALWRVMSTWIQAHSAELVAFQFPQGGEFIGALRALPEWCIASDGARALWEACVAGCPDATCLMFRDLVERVTAAAVREGVGIMNLTTKGEA